jgi:serine/threonine-protein kinase RsbW
MHAYGRDNHDHKAPLGLGLEADAWCATVDSQGELRLLFEKLERWMKVLEYPRKDIFAVLLAFSEATANAVRHGNQCDPGKPIQVRFLVKPDEVWVEVEDEGPGFDWRQVEDPLAETAVGRPSGRGLFLMRAYMSWVSFNPRGNRVTMGRQRSCR